MPHCTLKRTGGDPQDRGISPYSAASRAATLLPSGRLWAREGDGNVPGRNGGRRTPRTGASAAVLCGVLRYGGGSRRCVTSAVDAGACRRGCGCPRPKIRAPPACLADLFEFDSGVCLCGPYPIARGVPLGGVPSPLLWLVFFDPLIELIEERRAATGLLLAVQFTGLMFAGDLALVSSAPGLEQMQGAARVGAGCLREVLRLFPLFLSLAECRNLDCNPYAECGEAWRFLREVLWLLRLFLFPGSIFRRSPAARSLAIERRLAEKMCAAGRLEAGRPDSDPFLDVASDSEGRNCGGPFAATQMMRILGFMLDPSFTLGAHYDTLLCGAPIRQGFVNSLSVSRWGPEVGVLRMTRGAATTN